jgi:hypothetical protein
MAAPGDFTQVATQSIEQSSIRSNRVAECRV